MAEFHKFMANFSYDETQEIIAMFKRIEKEGYTNVRNAVTEQ